MERRNATAAVIGAGDFIGGAIARKFSAEGFTVFAGRRNGEKLAPLVSDIEGLGGRIVGRSLDARKEGAIFFTGATASLRGGAGYAAFAAAKAGLRAVAQSAARELGPQNIHVAHLVIDAGVDTAWVRERIRAREGDEGLRNPERLMQPASIAEAYWQLYQQPRDAWTFEMDIRPFGEKW
jgi:NADP-dependent 3-hydroxy acid dehydrogenase YdfG